MLARKHVEHAFMTWSYVFPQDVYILFAFLGLPSVDTMFMPEIEKNSGWNLLEP